jgi:hypothetical protein
LLSFVEAFWIMGVIFFCMLPLLLLLRNARDLHPHERKSKGGRDAQTAVSQAEPEPELIGAFH